MRPRHGVLVPKGLVQGGPGRSSSFQCEKLVFMWGQQKPKKVSGNSLGSLLFVLAEVTVLPSSLIYPVTASRDRMTSFLICVHESWLSADTW